jgi:PEGA domain
VTITTTPPGATAKLDGDSDKTCTTPCTLTAAQGPHKLTVELQGYYIKQGDIFVGADPVAKTVTLEAQTGTLMIGTLPFGMTIFVDGRQVQPGPVNLPVGTHRVLTELNGVRNEEIVDIHEGIRPYKVSVH